jgi:plasmid stabilization system protein ParE
VITRIYFHEDAEKEFGEAVAFYAMEEEALGLAFVTAVEEAIVRIAEHPESSPLVAGLVRRMRVARFPYSVLYSLHGDQVRVLAVAHDRRRPFFWRHRR